ncbi:hypothetical protein B0T10DRAFT_162327 [Thelonectria olida]|uniref:Uncharacterized protein n=1 Tax=Thelonectria olida TaxID=1576542 RepID=A0A9P8WFT2_9HYPO|nr:hypothetical protein B0T10DRAFT_162327 [Thelonectria olida]
MRVSRLHHELTLVFHYVRFGSFSPSLRRSRRGSVSVSLVVRASCKSLTLRGNDPSTPNPVRSDLPPRICLWLSLAVTWCRSNDKPNTSGAKDFWATSTELNKTLNYRFRSPPSINDQGRLLLVSQYSNIYKFYTPCSAARSPISQRSLRSAVIW